jgi:hypothetical protein
MFFEEKERDDSDPKEHNESSYSFLNRSSWAESKKVRDFLNDSLKKYPESEIPELISRVKSGDDRHFDSAIFELIIHQTLYALDYKLEPHPTLENGRKSRPDFLVESPNGDKFYLEAVLASCKTTANYGAERLKGTVYNSINKIEHPNFFVEIDDDGEPKTPPKGRILKKIIKKWLDSLDPDQVIKDVEERGFDELPELIWKHDGWNITFRALAVKPNRRGKGQRTIGMYSGGGGFRDSWTPIRDAAIEKGRRYGELEIPLVIAVNSSSFHLDKIDEQQALFGQEQYHVDENGKAVLARVPNGLWVGNQGAQYTRVSGVWIFCGLSLWSIPASRQTVYCNPNGKLDVPECLESFPHCKIEKGSPAYYEGQSLNSALGLNEKWPR